MGAVGSILQGLQDSLLDREQPVVSEVLLLMKRSKKIGMGCVAEMDQQGFACAKQEAVRAAESSRFAFFVYIQNARDLHTVADESSSAVSIAEATNHLLHHPSCMPTSVFQIGE